MNMRARPLYATDCTLLTRNSDSMAHGGWPLRYQTIHLYYTSTRLSTITLATSKLSCRKRRDASVFRRLNRPFSQGDSSSLLIYYCCWIHHTEWGCYENCIVKTFWVISRNVNVSVKDKNYAPIIISQQLHKSCDYLSYGS